MFAPGSSGLDIVQGPLKGPAVDHVVHLAARSGVPESWRNPERFHQTNVLGTLNVLEYCRQNLCSLTYVSGYVYGLPKTLPIGEETRAVPNNPYALTKFLAEETCRFYARAYDLPITILRPFNVYGPGQDNRFVIPHIVQQALDPATTRIEVNDLSPRRDYIFIDDVVDAIVLTSQPGAVATYNVGSGISHSVADVISLVSQVTGISKPFCATDRPRINEIPDVVADIAAIGKAVGWRPRITLEEGLRRVAEKTGRR